LCGVFSHLGSTASAFPHGYDGFSVLSNATVFLAPVGFGAVFLATSAAWLRLSRMATMVSLRSVKR